METKIQKTKKKALVIGCGKSGKAAAKRLTEEGYEVEISSGYDLVVMSPGVPAKSELQLGCEELKKRGVKMFAITGSKGKSSVVKLVADAIGGVACGNYGLPVSEVGETKWAVIEVSSFQLETTNLPPDTFEAAVILNLQDDHLDRHGSVEVYHALKRRLVSFAKCEITPQKEFDELLAGSYFDNEILRKNGEMAAGLMRLAGLSKASIAKAFAEFEPLAHRMERVGVFGGVECIDDSKATSLAALAAGVAMSGRKNRLIAGGLSKGDNPKSVISALTKWVKKVYLIGCSAEEWDLAWSSAVDCEICGTIDKAVSMAMREAEEGEALLLSPGAASFDQFKNFEERGEVFARLVKKEGQNK